jgi:WhiB family transcriptional regulator, redox-sensing transcriptional regulator
MSDVVGQWAADMPAGEGWRLAALCAQTDPECFFPEKGESVRPALRICGRCEPWVREACLADALRDEAPRGHLFGVRGGKTAREREVLLGKRKPKAEPVGGGLP